MKIDYAEKGYYIRKGDRCSRTMRSSPTILRAVNSQIIRRFTWLFTACLLLGYLLLSSASVTTIQQTPLHRSSKQSKDAVAVILCENHLDVDQNNTHSDVYFRALRVLHYQFRYANNTRYSDSTVPFIVLTTPQVAENKKAILRREGAIVIPVDNVDPGWADVQWPNWAQMFSKLEVWKLTQFSRILLIDSDIFLLRSLDGIFDDPGATPQIPTNKPKVGNTEMIPLPQKYLIGGIKDRGIGIDDYMNGGFFMLAPSIEMYNYMRAVLATPHSFEPRFQEQAMLNVIHWQKGAMPWKSLDKKWNTNWATVQDWNDGIVSVHAHWWDTNMLGCDPSPVLNDPVLATQWYRVLGHMEAFFGDI
jgi:alpha-N-acetylglucosamine transferase